MTRIRRVAARGVGVALITIVAMLLVAPATAFARPHRAASKAVTTVTVGLGDTSGVNGPMTMTVDPTSAPAGKVKFTVTNNGTILHEMVVLKLKTNTAYDKMPVNAKTHKVSEATNVGEVGDVPKGKTKSVTLKLKKGNYALVCNIAKHYAMGMRAAFTVT